MPRYCSTGVPITQRAYMLNPMCRIEACRNIAVTSRYHWWSCARSPYGTKNLPWMFEPTRMNLLSSAPPGLLIPVPWTTVIR